jgi:hypothetical protein
MERFQIITLVDITRSGASRSETNKLKIGQQANFNSLVQTIGLRANITWSQDPIKHTGRLPDPIDGKAAHWIWEFETERDTIFLKDQDPVGLLLDDLQGVPIVVDLENTADISPAAFQTKGVLTNTWIVIN